MTRPLKGNTRPEAYENMLDSLVTRIDTWFIENRLNINAPQLNFGILDMEVADENNPVEETDLDLSSVYFGEWTDTVTFQGEMIVGVENGLLSFIDHLIDRWFKYADNKDGSLDDVIDSLFYHREGLIHLMKTYTFLPFLSREKYVLPAKTRAEPKQHYTLILHDLMNGYGGVVFEKRTPAPERLSKLDKCALAKELAFDLGTANLNEGIVEYFDSKESFEKHVVFMDTVKEVLKPGGDFYNAVVKNFEGKQYPQTATGASIAEDARKQERLYQEMKRRVNTLENAAREFGPTDKKKMRELLQNAVEAKFNYDDAKAEAVHQAESAVNECVIRGAVISDGSGARGVVGGPLKRDLVLDCPPQLLSMDVYQDGALKTFNKEMTWTDQVHNAVYGLAEAGEVVNTLKKYFFHPWDKVHYKNFDAIRSKLLLELGDLQYYVAVLAWLFNFSLGEVGRTNRLKLVDRHGNELESPNAAKQKV